MEERRTDAISFTTDRWRCTRRSRQTGGYYPCFCLSGIPHRVGQLLRCHGYYDHVRHDVNYYVYAMTRHCYYLLLATEEVFLVFLKDKDRDIKAQRVSCKALWVSHCFGDDSITNQSITGLLPLAQVNS